MYCMYSYRTFACMYTFVPYACRVHRSQNWGLEPFGMQLWIVLPCGCWDANQGPPQEQLIFFTSEPPLQPPELLGIHCLLRDILNLVFIRCYPLIILVTARDALCWLSKSGAMAVVTALYPSLLLKDDFPDFIFYLSFDFIVRDHMCLLYAMTVTYRCCCVQIQCLSPDYWVPWKICLSFEYIFGMLNLNRKIKFYHRHKMDGWKGR